MTENRRSTTKLTEAQAEFFKLVRLRSVTGSPGAGQPYIAPALYKLTPVNARGLRTMAVDKYWRVYVDFDFFMAHPDPVKFAAQYLAHEPWHLLRDHNTRFELLGGDYRKNAKIWNLAGDLEINDDIPSLIAPEMLLPEEGDFLDFEPNKHAEVYFAQLLKRPDIVKKFQKPKPECTCDKGKQMQKQNQPGQQDGNQPQQGNQPGQQQGGNQPGQGNQPGNGGQGQQGQGQNGNQPGQQQGGQGGQPGGNGGQPGQGNGQGGQGQQGQGGYGNQPGGNGGQPGQGQNGQPTDQDGQGGQGDGYGDHDGHGDEDGQGHSHGNSGEKCPIHDPEYVIGCGSGAGEDLEDWELDYDPENSIDDEEHEAIKRQVAEQMRKTERSNPGSVPGWMQEWAGQVLAHKPVNWKAAFRASVKNGINVSRIRKMDYNKMRPKRRQTIPDVLLPGMQAPKPKGLFGFDVSGSNVENLGLIMEEACNIVKQVGIRGRDLRAFAVDVATDDPKPVNDPRKLLRDHRIGGGTLMRPAYELAARQRGSNRPDVFVLMTDGEVHETDFPDSVPDGGHGIKWVTCIITQKGSGWGQSTYDAAVKRLGSWGTVIHIETEG